MNKQGLAELISSEIRNALVEKAKGSNSQEKIESSESYLKSEEITEDDFDEVLFHGGNKPKQEEKNSKVFTIKEENANDIKITKSEITAFENSFKEFLGGMPNATVVFDIQENGHSLLATKKSDGIEAISSGIINLGNDGKILWSYSIMNGLTLNAQNLKLDNDTKSISENLYNHFIVWQKTWKEKLNYSEPQDQTV
jgi:hypothetical protein